MLEMGIVCIIAVAALILYLLAKCVQNLGLLPCIAIWTVSCLLLFFGCLFINSGASDAVYIQTNPQVICLSPSDTLRVMFQGDCDTIVCKYNK